MTQIIPDGFERSEVAALIPGINPPEHLQKELKLTVVKRHSSNPRKQEVWTKLPVETRTSLIKSNQKHLIEMTFRFQLLYDFK